MSGSSLVPRRCCGGKFVYGLLAGVQRAQRWLIYPISDVAGDYESEFHGCRPSGNDVFVATADQLVPPTPIPASTSPTCVSRRLPRHGLPAPVYERMQAPRVPAAVDLRRRRNRNLLRYRQPPASSAATGKEGDDEDRRVQPGFVKRRPNEEEVCVKRPKKSSKARKSAHAKRGAGDEAATVSSACSNGVDRVASSAAAEPFGLKTLEISAINVNGTPDVQAGSHPYELVTNFTLSAVERDKPGEGGGGDFRLTGCPIKDVQVQLPPGFVGNPDATPKCAYQAFAEKQCPNEYGRRRGDHGPSLSLGYRGRRPTCG